MYGGIRLDPKQRGHVHAARHTDPRQVVADQVDDDQILGTLFFAGEQAASKRVVLVGRAPPGSSSLDGLGFRDPIRGYPQEPSGEALITETSGASKNAANGAALSRRIRR